MTLSGEEVVCAPAKVAIAVDAPDCWRASGPGWAAYPEALLSAVGERLCDAASDPQEEFSAQAEARDLVVLAADGLLRGAVVSPDQALPIYLRNRVTAIPSRSAG